MEQLTRRARRLGLVGGAGVSASPGDLTLTEIGYGAGTEQAVSFRR
jgi:hypothetical protein